MGQIVRAIKGITESCKELDYPVVSGNVSLYNETSGRAIQPTPAIGGVGLLKNLNKRCDINLKKSGDVVFLISNPFASRADLDNALRSNMIWISAFERIR
jgi:phosphoribosylformylglycinamidine synthase